MRFVSLLLLAGSAMAATPLDPAHDYHSFSEPQKLRVTHVDLDLTVDFDHHQLSGHATLKLDNKTASKKLILDTRDLTISAVEAGADSEKWQTTTFKVGKRDAALGSPLTIDLPPRATQVRVHYVTSPNASALQWLTPTQTAGKKLPFLFSQSQAIHARSWIPLQDTPQVRMTYTATIHTPTTVRAVMSADNDSNAPRRGEYRFTMPQAIPSYLIALAVGDLEFKAMSARTGVYAEPATLDNAAAEFIDTENMIVATEKLYGNYAWGRYDLLILPPSFPFGGMENPRLSFITPTVIAGDKSLVNLIAHELAHSWSGNLVTNATWRDLWLNEGFTSYIENRIIESVYGRDMAVMDQVLDAKSLADDLAAAKPEDRVLAVDIRGRDPDDVFSDIPYVKGKTLLHYLEAQFGREKFDAFLNGYFKHFAFQTLNTETFVRYASEHLLKKYPGKVSEEKLNEWIYAQGMPADAPVAQSTRFDQVDAETAAYLNGKRVVAALKTEGWVTHEWLRFLDRVPPTSNHALLQELDARFHFTQSGNSEIAHRWFLLCIRSGYDKNRDALAAYLTQIGRRKLIVPLYDALAKTPERKAFAQSVYRKARAGYHPLAQSTLDKLLDISTQ